MSDSGKAVFLSYASQDAEAAKRICEALRAAGVEVWFDQSELVGGDAWDQKIRGQVGSCALFLPIISANTQARREGYFRIEWKLAAQRTHAMADGTPFLLPLLIDSTRDVDALVPAEFKGVQWTKLPGGETSPSFCARVKKLLDGEQGAGGRGQETVGAALRRDSSDGSGHKAPPTANRSGPSKWWWALPIFGVTMALLLVLKEGRKESLPAAPTTSRTAPAPHWSEARQLVAKAWEQMNKAELARAELDVADGLCKRATERDPNDADAWAAWSQVDSWYIFHQLSNTRERQDDARTKAARALQLAPDGFEARLAQACYLVRGRGDAEVSVFAPEAERLLRGLLTEKPDEPRALLAFGILERNLGHPDEARRALGRLAQQPAFAASGWSELGWAEMVFGDNAAAETAADRSMAIQQYWGNRALKVFMLWRRGDLESAERLWNQNPVATMEEDFGLTISLELAFWRRDAPRFLRLAQSVPRDWIQSNAFAGPTGWWTGHAEQFAGHAEAARVQWAAALKLVERRLAETPSSAALTGWKGELLAVLGERAESDKALQLAQEMGASGRWIDIGYARALNGHRDAEFEALERRCASNPGAVSAAVLRLSPWFDPLRTHPRFAGLQAQLDANARSNPEQNKTLVDQKSVAVLAFANLSDDKANEYFSDGISEELLNVLAKVSKLKVAARTSSFYFKGKDTPIPEIAQKLGVAYVVEGSVRKAGNKVRITAQLIKAADGFHVWSETYDRDLTDIFAVQDEIAKKILEVVKGSVLGEVELPHAATTKIEAYTLFLQAQGAFAKRGEAGLREAIRLFEAALAIDPNYVPALVGLAQARAVLPNYAYLSGPKARETVDAALKAARRALELDPQNAAAFAVIGWAKFQFEWKWGESEAALLRARDLAPNDHWNWNCLGDYYRFVGDFPRSLAAKQREWELDPLSPNSHWDLSYSHLVAGNYDQAIHWADLCVKLAPNNVDSYMPGILAAGRAGRFDLMRRTLAAARQNVHEGEGMMLLLEAYAAILEKKPDEVRRTLSIVMPLAEAGTASPAYVGYCLLLLGDADQAATWLQKGFDRSDPAMVWNEIIDFDVVAANPKTRPTLDQPGLKELYELRQRNARAGLNKL